MRKVTKYYDFGGFLGAFSRRRSRDTGTLVGIYNAEQAGMCSEGGPWVTLCENHGTLCNHQTLADAISHAPCVDWCEACMENIYGKSPGPGNIKVA